jgi:hypothetical protein
MSRLETMARFKEPDEVKPVAECDFCEKDLFTGDTVRMFDNDMYCSAECVANAYTYLEEL